MLDKATQIKNSFIYLLPNFVGFLIPIISLPIFTRILSPAEFGIYALAQVSGAFLSGIINFGLMYGYDIYFFEYHKENRDAELLYSILFFVIGFFISITAAFYLLKYLVATWFTGSSMWSDLFFWTFCAMAMGSLKVYYLAYFKNTNNAKASVLYTIDETVLGFLSSLLFVAVLRVGVIGLAWGQFLASLAVFMLISVRFFKTNPVTTSKEALYKSLRLSFPLSFKVLLSVVEKQLDKFVIGMLGTMGGLGIYSIGQKFANIVFIFLTSIANVFQPNVLKQMVNYGLQAGESIGKFLTPYFYTFLLFALFGIMYSEEVIILLTPSEYHGAIDVIIILSILNVTYFFGKLPQLGYSKKTWVISVLSAVTIALNLALMVPFTIKWGMLGTAWASLISGAISGALFFLLSQYYYEIKWEYPKMISMSVVFLASCLFLLIFRQTLVYPVLFAIKLAAISSYLYLGFKFQIFSRENFILIKDLLTPSKKTVPIT